jgi:ABC-2 type transport system permease protein
MTLNLIAYLIWTILGVAIGALLPRQALAVGLSTGGYLIGTQALVGIIAVPAATLHQERLRESVVLVPTYASRITVEGAALPQAPPRWVAAAVLAGYAAVGTAAGTVMLRRHDIT